MTTFTLCRKIFNGQIHNERRLIQIIRMELRKKNSIYYMFVWYKQSFNNFIIFK